MEPLTECPLCWSPVASSSLESHLRLELRAAVLHCSLCPRSFVDEAQAGAHFARAHPAHALALTEHRDVAKETRLRDLLASAQPPQGPTCHSDHLCCRLRAQGSSVAAPEELPVQQKLLGTEPSPNETLAEAPPSADQTLVEQPKPVLQQLRVSAASPPQAAPPPQLAAVKQEAGLGELKKVKLEAGAPTDGRAACLQCGDRIASKNFRDHVLQKHMEARPFLCNACPFKTKKKGNLVSHLVKTHSAASPPDPSAFTVLDLGREISAETQACFGEAEAAPVAKLRCRPCDVVLDEGRAKQHLLQVHLKRPLFVCRLCDFASAKALADLRRHLHRRHGQTPQEGHNFDSHQDALAPQIRAMLPELFHKI